MALHLHSLKILKLATDALLPAKDRSSVLLLSYPDLLIDPHDLTLLFGPCVEDLPVQANSEEILDHHKAHAITSRVVNTVAFFRALGFCTVNVLDIEVSRGYECVQDMNYPWQPIRPYDLVVDAGITDHCFNCAQVMLNAAGAVRDGGYILHSLPLIMLNHGFHNFSPLFFFDFYEQNGFAVTHYTAFRGLHRMDEVLPIYGSERVKNVAGDACQIVLAKRLQVQELKFPTQKRKVRNADRSNKP